MLKKLLFIGFLVPVLAWSREIKDEFIVTPEDFGCVSNNEEAAHENSLRLQNAIDYAIANGTKIVSAIGKKYYIKESLIINSPICIEFNMASLIATDTMEMIVINDGFPTRWAGKIEGMKLDLNKRARSGICLRKAVKLRISDCAIIGIPNEGVGLCIEDGYENFVDNVHFEAGENYAIGIKIATHDCHFSDCAFINCHTAIYCSGSNFFERMHAWMGSMGKWIENSVFFRINSAGPIFLYQCFSDTYDKAFEIVKSTRLFICQQKNVHNKMMWRKKTDEIHPVFFYFESEKEAKESYVILDNSFIGGLFVEEENLQSFSNHSTHHIKVNNTFIQ